MPAMLESGILIDGRYRLDALIGEGAMGQVWRAEDIRMVNKLVAIKFLIAQRAEDEVWRREFHREMQTLVKLEENRGPYSHLLQVSDYGLTEGIGPYMVMGYLSGGSLKTRLSEVQNNPTLLRQILSELCDALDYLHKCCGIVHLDLKPSNILFDAGNHIRLADFGIARTLDSIPGEVMPLGTPGYRAPEQEQGCAAVDRRADIYALGMVVRDLLEQSLTPQIEKLLDKATAPDPAARYTSANELWRALQPLLPRHYAGGYLLPEQKYDFLVKQLPYSVQEKVSRTLDDYTRVFGGRQAEMEALDQWLDEADKSFGIVQAPTGRGKTALLIQWALNVQGNGWHVIFFPISQRYETADQGVVVRSLTYALAMLFQVDAPGLNTAPDWLLAQVADWLRRGLPENKRLIVVVDGLDEAIGDYVGALFPNQVAPDVKILVAARTLANEGIGAWAARLKWALADTQLFDVGMLARRDLRDIVNGYADDTLQALVADDSFIAELWRVSEGDPLTARMVMDDLAARYLTPQDLSRRPVGLQAYLQAWLEGLEQQVESESAWQLLGLCATAYGPLTTDDLVALDPVTFNVARHVREAVRPVARVLLGDGEEEHGYVFNHPRLREFFDERLSEREHTSYQKAFVDYGQRCYAQLSENPCPSYVRRFWITHLARAGEWDLLHQVVATGEEQQVWAEMRYTAEGSYAGYLADLRQLWHYAEQIRNIALQTKCALIQSSIYTLSSNLSPELLIALASTGTPAGKWEVETALEHILLLQEDRRIKALQLLVQRFENPPFAQILKVVGSIHKQKARAEALAILIPVLPDNLLSEVWQFDDDLDRNEWVYVVARLLPRLDEEKQQELFQKTCQDIQHIQDIDQRITSGLDLASHIPEPHKRSVLWDVRKAMQTIGDEKIQAEKLRDFSIFLQRSGYLDDALTAAQAITSKFDRVVRLVHLAPALPTTWQNEAIQDAHNAALTISEASIRHKALALINAWQSELPMEETTFLTPGYESDYLREFDDWGEIETFDYDLSDNLSPENVLVALTRARYIGDKEAQLRATGQLIHYLPENLKDQVSSEILASAYTIESPQDRVRTILELLPHLPLDFQMNVITEASKLVSSTDAAHEDLPGIIDPDQEAIFEKIAVYSAKLGECRQAIDTACKIQYELRKIKCLFEVTRHLPATLHPEVLEIIFDIVTTIQQDDESMDLQYKDSAWEIISAGLAEFGWYQEALSIARQISFEVPLSNVLIKLASYLPATLHHEIINIARSCTHLVYDLIEIFLTLIPYLLEPVRDQIINETFELLNKHCGEEDLASGLIRLLPYYTTSSQGALLKKAISSVNKADYNENFKVQVQRHLILDLVTANLLWEAWEMFASLPRSEQLRITPDMALRMAQLGHYTEAWNTANNVLLEQPERDDLLAKVFAHVTAVLSLETKVTGNESGNIIQKSLALLNSHDGYKWISVQKSVFPKLLERQYFQDALTIAQSVDAETLIQLLEPYVFPGDLTSDIAEQFWLPAIHTVALQRREKLFTNLPVLLPLIVVLDGRDIVIELVNAIQEVCHWWP